MKKNLEDLLDEAHEQIETCKIDDAEDLLRDNDTVFIDVRDELELRNEGKLPGAVHISRGMLEFIIDSESPIHNDIFTEDKTFIFYCKSGGRSALAAQTAKKMGIKHVVNLNGGFMAWKERQGQIEEVI
ncbi:MAG TPA: rhodanese-like domain-containing protein [Balneolaceae bacterium]|nr:rhodanese-like domain-containing protein [Balneolaceae bacterium]